MIEFIMRMIVGHNHKWVNFEQKNIVEKRGDVPLGIIYVLRCDVCGQMRNHKVKW